MSLSRQVAKLLIRYWTSGGVTTTTLPLLFQQRQAGRCLWWQSTKPARRHQRASTSSTATALASSSALSAARRSVSALPLPFSLPCKQALYSRYSTMTTSATREDARATSKGDVASAASAENSTMLPSPPPLFDRSLFDRTVSVPALRVPAQATANVLRSLRGHTLDFPRMSAVVSDPTDPKRRLVLLSPSEFEEAVAAARKAENTTAEFLKSLPEPARELAISSEASLTFHDIKLTYAHVSVEEALRKLLPRELKELPSAFETVGHIAHLNLREELLPFKHLVGQVLLDKNPRLRVVVNKLASIQNEFRVFQMEVVAGNKNDTVAEVSQHGCRFGLDYAKVYWNSRLEAEHARLVENEFKPGQIIVDAMAGVGPFAVPAAKSVERCVVFANDLNPESFKWLKENARRNKVADKVSASCCDARDFIRAFGGVDGGAWERAFGEEKERGKKKGGGEKVEAEAAKAAAKTTIRNPPAALTPPPPPPKTGLRYHHVVMNLPATAIEFLDAFRGSLSPELFSSSSPSESRSQVENMPRVHVYCFEKAGEPAVTTITRVSQHLGGEPPDATVRLVRDVSPNKRMVCVSFTLPAAVALAKKGEGGKVEVEEEEASRKKRQKTDAGAEE